VIRVNSNVYASQLAVLAGVHWFNTRDFSSISRVDSTGMLMGGILYEKWRHGASVEMHMASNTKRWVSRYLLWMGFDYPFNQLGCKKVIGYTPALKYEALMALNKLGFTREGFIADVFADGSGMVISSMYKEQCRYLDVTPRVTERVVVDG
jgi:hypothetical protein